MEQKRLAEVWNGLMSLGPERGCLLVVKWLWGLEEALCTEGGNLRTAMGGVVEMMGLYLDRCYEKESISKEEYEAKTAEVKGLLELLKGE